MSWSSISDRCFTIALAGRDRAMYSQLIPDGYIPIFGPDVRGISTEYIEEVVALLGIETVARDYSAIADSYNGEQIKLAPLSENTFFMSRGAYVKTKSYTNNQVWSILRYVYEERAQRWGSYPLLCSDLLYPLPYIYFKDSHVCPAVALPVRNAFELIMVGLLYPTYPIYVQEDFTVRSALQPTFVKSFIGGEIIMPRNIFESNLDTALDTSFIRFLNHIPGNGELLNDGESYDDLSWEYGVMAVWQDDAGALNEAKIISNVQLAQILTSCSSRKLAVHLIIYPQDTSSHQIALAQNVTSSFKLESKIHPRLTVLGLEGAFHPTVLTDPITAPEGNFLLNGDEIRSEVFARYAYGQPHLCENVTHAKVVTVLWTERDVAESHVQYERFSFPAVYRGEENDEVTVGVRATLQYPPFKVLLGDTPASPQLRDLAPGVLSHSCQPFMASWEFLVRTDDVCDFLRLIRSHRFPYSKDPDRSRQLWSALSSGRNVSPLWDFISRDKFGGVVCGELQLLLSESDPRKTDAHPPRLRPDDDRDSFDISVMLPFLSQPSPVEYYFSGTRLPGEVIATTYDGDNDGNDEEEQLFPYCKIKEDGDQDDGPDLPDREGDDTEIIPDPDVGAGSSPGPSGDPHDNAGSDETESTDVCYTSIRPGLAIPLLALGVAGVYTFWLSKDEGPKHIHRNMLPLDSDSGEEFI